MPQVPVWLEKEKEAAGDVASLHAKLRSISEISTAFAGHTKTAFREGNAPPGAGLGWTPAPAGSSESVADAEARSNAAEAANKAAGAAAAKARQELEQARHTQARTNEANRRSMEADASKEVYCEAYESCSRCREHSVCAWCIGERTCVREGPWMCQGQEDTIHHKKDYVQACPTAEELAAEWQATEDERQAHAAAEAAKTSTRAAAVLEAAAEAELRSEQKDARCGPDGAGSGQCTEPAAETGCVGWRTTAGCTPIGQREVSVLACLWPVFGLTAAG